MLVCGAAQDMRESRHCVQRERACCSGKPMKRSEAKNPAKRSPTAIAPVGRPLGLARLGSRMRGIKAGGVGRGRKSRRWCNFSNFLDGTTTDPHPRNHRKSLHDGFMDSSGVSTGFQEFRWGRRLGWRGRGSVDPARPAPSGLHRRPSSTSRSKPRRGPFFSALPAAQKGAAAEKGRRAEGPWLAWLPGPWWPRGGRVPRPWSLKQSLVSLTYSTADGPAVGTTSYNTCA